MNHRTVLAGLTTLALAGGLAVGTAVPATAAPDPAPSADGAAWLKTQLTDGLVVNPNFGGFTDYGLSVDTGLAMAELGETATVDEISAALAPEVRSYYTYFVTAEKTHVAAGSLAKAVAFVQDAGDDTSSYGGEDLVTQLEQRVSSGSSDYGRLRDVFFPEEPFEDDFSNTIGQAFAAKALDVEGSPAAGPATEFLLAQQCEDGFFRLDLGEDLLSTCDSVVPLASPSTDATAIAVINLLGQTDDTDVDAAVDSAAAWLKGAQKADGSFGSDAQISASNANSTGLAAWALGELGEEAAAEKAAVWLRSHQVANTADCTPYAAADEGAVAYDDAAINAVVGTPVGDDSSDQFRRATAQALPGLRYAPAGVTSEVTSDSAYVAAGSTQRVPVSASPGDVVCLQGAGATRLKRVPLSGETSISVTLPAGTGNRSYVVQDTSETLGTVTFRALGAKTFGMTVRKPVARTKKQLVQVRGLAAGERVRVFFGGKVVGSGRASAAGTFQRSFVVPRSAGLGPRQVRVVGEFGNRTAKRTFKVVRPS